MFQPEVSSDVVLLVKVRMVGKVWKIYLEGPLGHVQKARGQLAGPNSCGGRSAAHNLPCTILKAILHHASSSSVSSLLTLIQPPLRTINLFLQESE